MDVKFASSPPSGWNDFVKNHPHGKIYHLVEWGEIIQKTFGHTPFFVFIKNNEMLDGVMPLIKFNSPVFGKFAVSMPFVNYGGILFNQVNEFQDVVNFLSEFQKREKMKFIEIRYDSRFDVELPYKQHKVTFMLDLPSDEDQLWKSFKSKTRSQIRRPLKENMYARTGGIELLDLFYQVFAHNMRDLGTPVYTKKFFKNILTTFPDDAFLVVVFSKDDIPTASSFLLKFKDTMEIPWASSIRKYNRFSPNMLLYWESLKLAIQQGLTIFDFGRCTPGSGTYRFKKQWGAQEMPLFWYYILPEFQALPEMNPQNSKFNLAIKVWQRLPIFITNAIGPKIIRHIP